MDFGNFSLTIFKEQGVCEAHWDTLQFNLFLENLPINNIYMHMY